MSRLAKAGHIRRSFPLRGLVYMGLGVFCMSVVDAASNQGHSPQVVASPGAEGAVNPEQALFDRLLSDDVLRAIDQLAVLFTQIRQECEFPG